MSLTKNLHPQPKIFFRVRTARLATSFDTFTRSVTRTGAEIFPRKATCDQAVFLGTASINPDVKVLNMANSTIIISHKERSCFEDQCVVCITFVKTLIFTGIQRVKTGLFYKSSSQSLIDTWFIYYVMEHWIIPRQKYLVAVINDIWFVPITWIRCPFCGKLVYSLANILLVAYHTSPEPLPENFQRLHIHLFRGLDIL